MAKKALLLMILVVAGVLVVKAAEAMSDVHGLEADLKSSMRDLPLDCAGSRVCGDQLVDAIEELRVEHGRDVVIDYETLDLDAEEGVFFLKGVKVVDFYVNKYVWNFEIKISMIE